MAEPTLVDEISVLRQAVEMPDSASKQAAIRAAVQCLSPEQVQRQILLELMEVRLLLDRVSGGGNAFLAISPPL